MAVKFADEIDTIDNKNRINKEKQKIAKEKKERKAIENIRKELYKF